MKKEIVCSIAAIRFRRSQRLRHRKNKTGLCGVCYARQFFARIVAQCNTHPAVTSPTGYPWLSSHVQRIQIYFFLAGTLLGAYRTGDILPHDHDADISFLLSSEPSDAFRELTKSGINANGLAARFGEVSLDFVRWRPQNRTSGGKTEVMLHKFYPSSVKDNALLRYHHTLETFPQEWALPSARIDFHGVNVSIPNSPERLLAFRYPWTYGTFGFQFPYKWKCWVPCWLRKSNGC